MELVHFVYVRLLLAEKRWEDARALLSTMEQSTREGGRLRKLITVCLLRAVLQQTLGYKDQAVSLVEEAIRLAAPQGYVRAFLDEGAAIVALLPAVRTHLDGTVGPEFVSQVLNAAGVEPAVPRTQALVEPLSHRELQVLRLLASGLSSTEVAEALYIAVGTSRTHIKNIYSKLNVHRRSEAIGRAQEMGLI
jgi:LuxR family maltose regulon positive regulatory protein